ncbi:glycosyltransferase family 4 protein [Mucilaginibacter sp. BT774]|uniref:glycosyltransferase family 4 protein n=1 Tax=Mucilaginibacter sp. BT774 TaxID=3062276 RepID=UPI002675A6C3|nr:glycosyltransferase family 4 protein [Mucilaginibacter sp. BT774]MDO3628849.1 glycosyltransferase family 4 protein [Mucilaginibacter sp. BT774]
MKIVHCFFTMHTGGSQVLAIDMLNEMCKQHEVSLIVVNDQWNEKLLKRLSPLVKIYLINRKEGSRNPLPVLRFNLLLHKLKPDVIHCHEIKLVNLIRFGKVKTVYTVHDVGIKNPIIDKYDSIIAISSAVATDVKNRFNIEAKVIHNGIPMNNFKKKDDYEIKEDRLIKLVQISRLIHEKKGQDILIKTMHKLIVEQGKSNLVLDIIGTGQSMDYLKSLAIDLGISRYINFLGEKDRAWIYDNLANYDVLIQPSRFEGFGLTVVEGVAAGLPVVASNIEGPAEIMEDIATKFLFEAANIDDCAHTINELIDYYQEGKIKQVLDETYISVKKRFSIESSVTQYLDVYSN